jgi:hypothetical protein
VRSITIRVLAAYQPIVSSHKVRLYRIPDMGVRVTNIRARNSAATMWQTVAVQQLLY